MRNRREHYFRRLNGDKTMAAQHPMSAELRETAERPDMTYPYTMEKAADALDAMQARCDALADLLTETVDFAVANLGKDGPHTPWQDWQALRRKTTDALVDLANAERAHREGGS